ncbi:MAG: ATP-binding protein, partial [Saprospiraceae bacterium]
NFKPYLIPNAADSEFWLISDTNRKNLWVTDFTKNILYRYDIQQDAFISIVEGYSSEALLEDEKGYWIASFKNGLLHYDPHTQQVRKYGKQQGLNDNQTVEIHSTEAGIYWVATRKGISKFTAATETFENAGLPRGYYHPMWLKSKDEQLFFGSDEGTIAFYPDEINGNPHPPKVLINDLQISGEVYPLHDLDKNATIEVGYQQNDFNFSYTALHYSKPNENKYQYKLSPFDNDWIDGGTQRNVRYTNLESGEYTFQVKASNSDGIWTSKATTLAFQINPAWWTRWWFYILTISVLGSISYWFYRFQLSRKLAVERSERLAEINRLKTGLYNNITHEFRTPLTVILGLTSDLKTEASNTWNDAIRPLELIERNGKKLLQLINEMLALAKLESGHLQLEQLQIDVIPFLKYLCESFQSLAARNNISLAVEAEIDELIMDVDKDKLTTIVANLLSNAIKFTSKNGSVIVRLNQGKTAAQEFFIVEITDNGKGIAATELPHIFDRFYQADNRSVRRYEGTGIGLALTKELVELMNGKIEVKSKLGKGSTFSVQLPITKSAPLITAPQPSILTPQAESFDQIQTTQNAPTNLPIVLMIEDNPDVAFYIKSCLHETYQILYATDGQIGIDMALQHIPDLIISDVMMPRKDGFEVCQTLKADERTNHIPIILLTAKATIEDRLTGLKQGADVYLAKPFEKEELLVRLRKLLELRQLLQHKYSSQLLPIAATKTIKEVEDPFIKKAKAIVLENIADEAFNSPQLEKALHLSRSQVYRKIKAVTGYSTAIFIRHLRLQEAVKLLQSTSLSISEIAYQVGFKSPVYFSQVFKETFNQSPTDLRN